MQYYNDISNPYHNDMDSIHSYDIINDMDFISNSYRNNIKTLS